MKLYWRIVTPISIVYGYFQATEAELNNFKRDYVAHKAENIYHMSLYRRGVLTPNPAKLTYIVNCDLTSLTLREWMWILEG